MADTIAVMSEGRIEQLGTGEELYERPRTEFVANFLGLSNLLDGTAGRRDGALTEFVTDEGVAVRVPTDRLEGLDAPLRVGVRPEKITIAAAGEEPSGLNALRGHVAIASYLGVSISYQVATPAGRELTVIAPNRHLGDASTFGPGQEVLMTWEPAHTFAVSRQEPT